MSLTITNLAEALKEPDFFGECVLKATNYEDAQIVMHVYPRAVSGWLEWGLEITHANGRKGFVGCIQRKIGNRVEFCT